MAYGQGYGNFWNSLPSVTKNIILINILMFLATLANQNFMVGTFALFFPKSPFFHWWQPVTHMFMHGGFWHILFNSRKFLLFYFVTGLGAAALHQCVTWLQFAGGNSAQLLYVPMLGASGAIYGVLLAYAMLYPDSVLTLIFPPVSMKAKWFVLIFAGIELLTGIIGSQDGIAHFAHLGGMLFGWLMIAYWKKKGTLYDEGYRY